MTSNQFTVSLDPYVPQQMQDQPGLNTPSFDNFRQSVLAPLRSELDEICCDHLNNSTYGVNDSWRIGQSQLIKLGKLQERSGEIADIFERAETALTSTTQLIRGRHSPPPNLNFQHVRLVATKLRISPLAITQDHMREFKPSTVNQFQISLPQILGKYRDAYVRNSLARLRDNGVGSTDSLPDKEFRDRYGLPPWEQISDIFRAFGVPYAVKIPDLYSYAPVTFSMMKVVGGEEVLPSALSSGEQTLFQFALSLFRYDEELTTVTRPKLLLLDEVDAPLHPEMVNRWLSSVIRNLVEQQSICCILTTHSPTTVALAPEDALYEMANGQLGLQKITKQDALNKLTFGVPTLSIDYSGRRQVFAESDTDAANYERVYSLIKSSINCPRELNFLSTGMRNKNGGEINSGCTIVTNIVNQLTRDSNPNVYGLVDWDGKTTSTKRIKVIAEGARNGIENVLLDPLLICLLLMKDRKAPKEVADLERFSGADKLDLPDLQRLVDAVQIRVFPNNSSGRQDIFYMSGVKTSIIKDYLLIDDHKLEALLANAFPSLQKWTTSGRGNLVKTVIDQVLTEHRSFCLMEIIAVFEAIANATE